MTGEPNGEQRSPPLLVGRDSELETLGRLIEGAPEHGGAVLLVGDAGFGKSSLLAEAARRAGVMGYQTHRLAGVQAEMQLPFAGLQQLLLPFLTGMTRLPSPQRRALEAALGIADRNASDLFLVALGALALLSDAAVRRPLAVVIDDAQWLDSPSATAVGFVCRRLGRDPIVILAAVRSGFASPLLDSGLPELALRPLDGDASREILRRSRSDLPPSARRLLLREAQGNPLALLELPKALSRDARDIRDHDGSPLPTPLPLTARLERAFAARLSEVQQPVATALLVAAVDDRDLIQEILRATRRLTDVPVSETDLLAGVEAGLIEIMTPTLRFRHPLVRSALMQAATEAQRRAAHEALASLLGDDPDRRAWHLAAAIGGRSAAVAQDLDAVASRAERRGALGVAVAALQRAAELSEDTARRSARLMRAAELSLELGHSPVVDDLVGLANDLPLGPVERARLAWIREMTHPHLQADPGGVRRVAALAEAAHEAGQDDVAGNLLWLAASRCFWTDPGPGIRKRLLSVSDRLALNAEDPTVLAIAAFLAPIERGRHVAPKLEVASRDRLDPEALRRIGTAAFALGEFDLASQVLDEAVGGLRREGRLAHLPHALAYQAWSAFYRSDWRRAVTAADEASRLASEAGEVIWIGCASAVMSLLAAVRGEDVDGPALSAERAGTESRCAFVMAAAQVARGLAALGHGKPADAFVHLHRPVDIADPAHHPFLGWWGIGDLTEAAAAAGLHRDAEELLEQAKGVAEGSGSAWLRAAVGYATPFIAMDEQADDQFRDALECQAAWPFQRGRTLLAYGAWLRRHRRIADARGPLRSARDAFDVLGAAAWSERARGELRAAGEVSPARVRHRWDQLSPQELQIAELAAEGLSNREIAARLYISPRTVSFHLYRVFPKLGVTSRTQLHAALDVPRLDAEQPVI